MNSNDSPNAPLLDAGRPPTGPSIGGMARTDDHGPSAASRSTDTVKSPPPARGFEDEDEDDSAWPKALPDSDESPHESAAQSLGRSISQIITGGTHENKVEDDPKKTAR